MDFSKEPRTARRLAAALACLLAACGGGNNHNGPADASPLRPDAPAATPDAAATPDGTSLSAACQKIASPAGAIDAIPGMYTGDLTGETSAIDIAAAGCTHIHSTTGISFPGPEQVVAINNLTPNTQYAVRVDAAFDAAFYVVTGCAGDGPSREECLNAVNRAGAPTTADPAPTEAGLIAPPDGTAYVVIEAAGTAPPSDGGYTVKVYKPGCTSSFDCDAQAPVCAAFQCAAAAGQCVNDDSSENGDDGPSGAVDITPGSGSTTSITRAHICSQPATEADWYQFTVTSAPATATVSVDAASATGGDPLVIHTVVFDSQGRRVGFSFYNRPESVGLTFLPADTYYVKVAQLAPAGDTTVAPYTLTLSLTQGVTGCTGVADCASTYENQNFRGNCAGDGSCQFIDGQKMVSLGGLCDSNDDCDPTTADLCTGALAFVAGADQGGFCSVHCTSDADCQSALGSAGDKCTIGFAEGDFCMKSCQTDEDCPVDFQTPLNWKHTSCDATGHCSAM